MDSLLRLIKTHSSFLISTHDFPDGDGLGSELALHQALLQLGKKSHVINPGPTPDKFSLVDPHGWVSVFSVGQKLPAVDAVVIVDTNELKMMGPMERPLKELGKPCVFLDHHVPESLPPGDHWVDESYAATGELTYHLLNALGVSVNQPMATALYVALITDTGGFRFKRTSPRSHQMAADLLEKGVDPEGVHRFIFARESPSKMRFFGHTLEKLQVGVGGKLAWIVVEQKPRERYGATIEDTESFIGALTLLEGVEIAVLFREEAAEKIKVSLRGLGKAPVVDIAQSLGGGGHRFAAGARVSGKLDEVRDRVLAACEARLR